ncbi:MAG: DUF2961 domain-containing protein [Alphaproteobacteria bacterium]|nr:DUF2961 domain-containing protein [Alphaproteobacteria bacterium]
MRMALLVAAMAAVLTLPGFGQPVDGLTGTLSSLYRTSDAQTRSISPENPTGEPGKGGMATTGTGQNAAKYLGRGWKISPSIRVNAGERATLADVAGTGAIQHIWLTPAVAAATTTWRSLILRIWWDDEKDPSVEVPLGDFFAMGLGQYAQVNSLAITVNPGSAFNSYWPMPFRKHMRIEVENRAKTNATLYFQIDYALGSVAADAATFHAQFRQVRPLPDKTDYVILDGVRGRGQYVGTYMTYGIAHSGWWGEGEIKFFMDGDREFPTIAGTGTEDYFNGSYDFVSPLTRAYQEFSGPYTGLVQVLRPEDREADSRFGLYRWHITDPVRFKSDLKVTIQGLGWQQDGEARVYRPIHENISSVAFWYQQGAHAPYPALPPDTDLQPQRR